MYVCMHIIRTFTTTSQSATKNKNKITREPLHVVLLKHLCMYICTYVVFFFPVDKCKTLRQCTSFNASMLQASIFSGTE